MNELAIRGLKYSGRGLGMPIKSSDNNIFGKLKQWIVGVTGVVCIWPLVFVFAAKLKP